MSRMLIAGLLLSGGALAGYLVDPHAAAAAWLAAWWMQAGLLVGAVHLRWVARLTGGQWGPAIEPAIERLQRNAPGVGLLFLPVLASVYLLYPWLAHRQAWIASMDEPAFAIGWFSPTAFALRVLIYGVAWCALGRAKPRLTRLRAALALLAGMVLTTLASIDLVMSLTGAWVSTVFGWLMLCGAMLGAMGCVIVMRCRAQRQHVLPALQAGVSRDLGNLLLMWVMVQGYLAFMQWLIIWAEDLPREIVWYLPRVQGPWATIILAIVALLLAVPMVLLLFRRVKDDPARLRWIAWLVLVGQALNCVWTIVPSVASRSMVGLWTVPMAMAGMALLLFGQADVRAHSSAARP